MSYMERPTCTLMQLNRDQGASMPVSAVTDVHVETTEALEADSHSTFRNCCGVLGRAAQLGVVV